MINNVSLTLGEEGRVVAFGLRVNAENHSVSVQINGLGESSVFFEISGDEVIELREILRLVYEGLVNGNGHAQPAGGRMGAG